jgi:DNA-binding NarL/FixJ family response regulator
VLELVARGWRNREIGAALFIAPGTVRKHLDNVYAKLGVRSCAQVVAAVMEPCAAP